MKMYFKEHRRPTLYENWKNYHCAKLKSGHIVRFGWIENEIYHGKRLYRAYYNSIHSGGHHISRLSIRELFGTLRSAIAFDINPDVEAVNKRILRK